MKIRYKQSIVIFLDVLGFSNLVYSEDNSVLEKYFDYVKSDLSKHLNEKGFSFVIISDSIVISGEKNKENLSELIYIMSKIQYQLLLRGILIRGGLSFGNLHINKTNNIIVGPGLINAYKLEGEAKYPRIIIDRKVIPEFFISTKDFLEYLNSFFLKLYDESDGKVKIDLTSKDGKPFINYLRMFVRDRRTFGKMNITKLITFLKNNYYSNEHFEKYNWLIEELKIEIDLAIEHYSSHPEFRKSNYKLIQLKKLKSKIASI